MIATQKRPDLVPGLVSVVVPAYNAGKFIAETLASVNAQTYPSVEIIVVDDGSTDDTRAVVQSRFPSVVLLTQANSGGCSSPRNHGASVAKGEFVTFFDADDIMRPDKLKRQCEWLRHNPHAAAVVMDYQNFDEQGPWKQTHFETCTQLRALLRETKSSSEGTLKSEDSRRILATENFVIAGSPVIRASAFHDAGRFDEELLASEDWEFFYRLSSGSIVGILDEVGFMRRMHSLNMSHRTEHILSFKIKSRCKILDMEPTSPIREAHRRMLSDYHFDFANFLARSDSSSARNHLWTSLRYGQPMSAAVVKCMVKCMARSLRLI